MCARICGCGSKTVADSFVFLNLECQGACVLGQNSSPLLRESMDSISGVGATNTRPPIMRMTSTDFVVAAGAQVARLRFVLLDTDIHEGAACRLMHHLVDLRQQR